ncbi:MAG: multiheme c-type cytochrome [Armatimonadota bacterium]|nr:cytochrome C [Armatimonadota bacterium]MDW8025408.1 multiheme c-type cytochrome [Armatimonadota bacterium]
MKRRWMVAVFWLSLLTSLALWLSALLRLNVSSALQQANAQLSEETIKCIQCHQAKGVARVALRDWSQSRHAQVGVGCEECHIPVAKASGITVKLKTACENSSVRRRVSALNCAECHQLQFRQFTEGKHALAWVAMNAIPITSRLPKEIAERGCGGCHNIGRDEGKCDSCHTRHLFSAAEARRAEACQTCHMGFDHPQWEMFSTSKHGTIYLTQGSQWDWTRKLKQWFADMSAPRTPRAPTCAFCHMPDGDHAVKTAWGFLAVRLGEKDKEWERLRNIIFRALGVIDEKGNLTERFKVVAAGKVARLSIEEWQQERNKMIQRCATCHSQSFARETLEQADRIIKEADRLLAEAVQIVESLYRDGILPRPKDRPPVVDLLRFYEVENPIEQRLYIMFLSHRMRTFQGAFHMNPDYLHWYGWAEMRKDLAEIKAEARRLREERKRK